MLPAKIANVQEAYCLDKDQAIAVLRHFSWDEEKMQESWFDNELKISYQLGLKLNKASIQSLTKEK